MRVSACMCTRAHVCVNAHLFSRARDGVRVCVSAFLCVRGGMSACTLCARVCVCVRMYAQLFVLVCLHEWTRISVSGGVCVRVGVWVSLHV